MDQERIESIKAGMVAAFTGAGVSFLCIGLEIGLGQFASASTPEALRMACLRTVVAMVCAFLFGITYRYIVRQDANPHLRSGAVGAFALTRSLSQLEMTHLLELGDILTLLMPVVESFGLFGSLRWVLDGAIRYQWIQPFGLIPSK